MPPELAGYFLHNDYQQPAKSSRDMWSLGGILLAMITGSTITEVMKDRFSPDPANDNRGALHGLAVGRPPTVSCSFFSRGMFGSVCLF